MGFQAIRHIHPFLSFSAILAGGTIFLALPARAGFEWTPPPAPMVSAPQADTKNTTPPAVPVTPVEGTMLPMPAEPGPAPVQNPPAQNLTLSPAVPQPAPVQSTALPAPAAQPVQKEAVIKTLSLQDTPPQNMPAENMPGPQTQPVAPAASPAPVRKMAAPAEAPPRDTVFSASGTPGYVAKESVTKRIRYSDWLTEAQAQEMSMKIHQPQDTPFPQDSVQENAAPAVIESRHVTLPEDAPEGAVAAARNEDIKPVSHSGIESAHLPPPVRGDVMPLLTPEDLTIAPYPVQQPPAPQASTRTIPAKAAPTKIVMPEDAPAPAKKPGKTPVPPQPLLPQEKIAAFPDNVKIPAADSKKAETFTGFGNDIPLAFAMEQILPEGYNFDFGDSVNPEERVSWQGGKPWQDVVRDILTPLNLTSRIDGKTVYITKKS